MILEEINQLNHEDVVRLSFEKTNKQIEVYYIDSGLITHTALIAVWRNEWKKLSTEAPLPKLRAIEEYTLYVTDETKRNINIEFPSNYWGFTIVDIKYLEELSKNKSLENILTDLQNEIK